MFQGVGQRCLTRTVELPAKISRTNIAKCWKNEKANSRKTSIAESQNQLILCNVGVEKWFQQIRKWFPQLSKLLFQRKCTLSSITLPPHWSHWACSWWSGPRRSWRRRTGRSAASSPPSWTGMSTASFPPSFGFLMFVFSALLQCFSYISSLVLKRRKL